MRHFYRLIILAMLLVSPYAYALGLFLDVLDWRPTETNDWAYLNSKTLPTQSLTYKTIDFPYTPGFRLGITHNSNFDSLLSFTHLYATTNDSAVGNIQPAFLGSVTAKPFPPGAYLYQAGQVKQTIDFNIFNANIGKAFSPAASLTLHPMIGLMGGWINQSFDASYTGSTSTNEKIANNFKGLGPKIGFDTSIRVFNYQNIEPSVIIGFAASYLIGSWHIRDTTLVTPTAIVNIKGANHTMGALTLEGLAGFNVNLSKNLKLNLAYEISDWFDQNQIFDNDTGAHNNDLVLQGLTLGVSYNFS